MMEAAFTQAMLNSQAPLPQGLIAWNGSDVSQRFAVYRNNFMVSLIESLADSFPVTCALVGDIFFREMARVWVPEHLPTSPVLARYGADFPDFIATFQPAARLPYLSDVARLEWAYVQAFHAADATVLPPEEMAHALTQPERLAQFYFTLHPSVISQVSAYAIASLWAAHQLSEVTDLPDPYQPEAALLLRPNVEAKVLRIDIGTHVFIQKMQCGLMLGEAVEAAFEAQPDFDLTKVLALLIREQAIHSVNL